MGPGLAVGALAWGLHVAVDRLAGYGVRGADGGKGAVEAAVISTAFDEERAAGPLVRAVGGDRDAARALWAFAHGMTILELDGRFPSEADLDAAWRRGLAAFRGL